MLRTVLDPKYTKMSKIQFFFWGSSSISGKERENKGWGTVEWTYTMNFDKHWGWVSTFDVFLAEWGAGCEKEPC